MPRRSERVPKLNEKGKSYHVALTKSRVAKKTRRNRKDVRGELQAIPLRRTRSRSSSHSSSRSSRSSMNSLASKMKKLSMGSH